MSDGSIFDLSKFGADETGDHFRPVSGKLGRMEPPARSLKPGGSGNLQRRDDIQRGYLFDLIGPIRDVLASTTETPTRDSLIAMIGAVIGIHAQYSGIGDVELNRAPQWLEAIEAADPDIARHTRALETGETHPRNDAAADLEAVGNIFDVIDDDLPETHGRSMRTRRARADHERESLEARVTELEHFVRDGIPGDDVYEPEASLKERVRNLTEQVYGLQRRVSHLIDARDGGPAANDGMPF